MQRLPAPPTCIASCTCACSYEVRKKKKGCVDEIADLIRDKFTLKVQPANKRSWAVQVSGVLCCATLCCAALCCTTVMQWLGGTCCCTMQHGCTV